MDDNLNRNQQNWGGINNNKPMPPPPPPPEITLRTMQSDIDSIKQSGGESAAPEPFTPPEVKKEPVSASSTATLDDLSKEEGMIKPNAGDGAIPPSEMPKNKSKAILLVIVLLLIAAGLAYAGYTYIYPMFIKTTVPAITTPPPSTQAPETILPVFLATTTEEIIPTGEIVATNTIATLPLLKSHLSFLTVLPESAVNLTITAPITLTSIKEALSAEADKKPQTETALKETVLTDSQTGQLVFSEIFPMFFSEFVAPELSSLFEDDFTAVIFYDKNGAWPGLIAKVKQETDINTAKTLITNKLEKSAGLVNLYLQDSGVKSAAGFKTGAANSQPTRYISFAKTGASFNYAWVKNNMLVISASYDGLKVMLTNMGVQ